jgi:hypothetical protein
VKEDRMTPTAPTDARLVEVYERAAREYYRSLPIEETIDPVSQGVSRHITLASFSLIHALRPDVQCFNELLIEYPRADGTRGRIVPSNFVVVHPTMIEAYDVYDLVRQPAAPLLVIEYITDYRRPEFLRNVEQYERELRVPYYLRVYPHDERVELFRPAAGRYTTVPLNAAYRVAIPELELEVAVFNGWVRYWFQGELLPLPGELLRQCEAAEAEVAKLREELAKAKGSPT